MALKLLITDDPHHEKYYEIENWEVIPVEKRASHTCYKDAALGSNFWPKLLSVVPGKSDKVESLQVSRFDINFTYDTFKLNYKLQDVILKVAADEEEYDFGHYEALENGSIIFRCTGYRLPKQKTGQKTSIETTAGKRLQLSILSNNYSVKYIKNLLLNYLLITQRFMSNKPQLWMKIN